jgi:drug/metabolite transporter (DMT)-like permease
MIATRTPIFWPSHLSFIVLLLAVCVFGLFGQTLMVMGFQREDAGRASMGQYVGIIFGVLLGWLVFGTVPGLLSAIGMVLILGSAIYVAVIKESDEEKLDVEFEDECAEVGLLGMEGRGSREMGGHGV